MRSKRDEIVDICAVIHHRTDRAVLIDHGGKDKVWLPLAHAEVEANEDGRTHTVSIPQWLAEDKGIV